MTIDRIKRIKRIVVLNPVVLFLLRKLWPEKYYDTLYTLPPTGAVWDIHQPQPEIVSLVKNGEVNGDILDVGCGTGENSIYLAREGFKVVGVDFSSSAIQEAKKRAESRGVNVSFEVADALKLQELGCTFDTIIDSFLFHGFTHRQRLSFVQSLSLAIRHGGTYFMLSIGDEPTTMWRRMLHLVRNWKKIGMTRREIDNYFKDGWRVNYVREAEAHQRTLRKAWLASITRL